MIGPIAERVLKHLHLSAAVLAVMSLSQSPAVAAPKGAAGTDLSGVTQNWDKTLPTATRFIVLGGFNNEAVRDNETGLVWEQSPHAVELIWAEARTHCINKNVGFRKGWRLPSVAELATLVDPSVPAPQLKLPPGHPFQNVQVDNYWSATTDASTTTNAWTVDFANSGIPVHPKSLSNYAWCVRGGMNPSQY
jgi:hypothetical protein